MLAKTTKRVESLATSVQRTDIELVLMPRTREVLVQRRQAPIRPMAEVALVGRSVPRSRGRTVSDLSAGPSRARDHARGVRDEVVDVLLAYGLVDERAVDSRAAAAAFEV